MDDSEFRRLIRCRDPAAWERLFHLYWTQLYRQARLLLPGSLDPENAVGEVWLRAFGAARKYDASRSPYPWLARICANVCLNTRHRPRERGVVREVAAPAAVHPEAYAAAREALRFALAGISRHQREVVALRFLFNVSVTEIAELLRIRRNSVEQTLLRGLECLRRGRSADELGQWMSVFEGRTP